MLRKLLILFLMGVLITPALARPVSLYVQVDDESGVDIGAGAAVQVIQPSAVTSPTHGDYLATGTLKADETPAGTYIWTNSSSYVSATTTGPNQFLSQGTGAAVLRIWNGASPGAVIAVNGYYGYHNYNLGLSTDAPLPSSGTVRTSYQAIRPAPPTIGPLGVVYHERDEDLVGAVSVPITANTTRYELSATTDGPKYEIRIGSAGSGVWTIQKGGSGATVSTDPDVVAERLALGGDFDVQARCRSHFGPSEWSATATFPTAGVGGGPTTAVYNFRRPGGEIGLNPIAFPFANVTDADVENVSQLVEEINTQAGANIVTAVGWWDAENQRPTGYIITYEDDTVNNFNPFITAGGAPDEPASVTLVMDQSYQISVLADATATLRGTR